MNTKINYFIILISTLISINCFSQLKVSSSGKVRIGSETSWNDGSLQIMEHNKTTELRIFATSPNIARLWTMNQIYSYRFGVDASGIGRFYRNVNSPGYVMSFNSSGNVSIGTSSVYSQYRLYISGDFRTYGQVTCRDGYWASSDMRLMSNISSIEGALDKVMNLNGKTYNLKSSSLKSSEESNKIHYGLIAQDVQKIIPELVEETKDSISSLAINYDGLIPVLIEAIKEQQTTIEGLKSEIEKLRTLDLIKQQEQMYLITNQKISFIRMLLIPSINKQK